MSNLFKDIYSVPFYNRFSDVVGEVIPAFGKEEFIQAIFDKDWNKKELKERMKHTSSVLHRFLPKDFVGATEVIEKIIVRLQQSQFVETSVEFMFFPDYIEKYGIDHFDAAVNSFEFVTQFTSCEFAVRPFIVKYGDKMIKRMNEWSLHKSDKVRRLASEGSRPRLPWAIALPELKKDPSPILPILENLKNDSSESVRRSVANNLNDIAKDNPDIVVSIAKKWKGYGKETDAIIKHGCRTLLKQGHAEILEYFGLSASRKIKVSGFEILTPGIKIGESLEFTFSIQNNELQAETVRLEYGIFYLRQNGQLSKKVFKISERQFQPKEECKIRRKQSFKIITTRKFYPGKHKLSIIVNGQEREVGEFELTE